MITNIVVGNKNVRVDTLACRWIHDSENIVNAQTEQQFFMTKAAKTIDIANFEGDQSLVPEGHVFQVIAHVVHVRRNATVAANTRLTQPDAVELYEQGYVDWQIQGTVAERMNARFLAGGFDFATVYEPANIGAADAAVLGNGTHANARRYEMEKIVPGGRAMDYWLRWPGGITLGTTRNTMVSLFGIQAQLV